MKKNLSILNMFVALLVLPALILGAVPGVLIHLYGFAAPHPYDVGYWFSKVMLPGGLVLAGLSVAALAVHGRGMPAPWSPPSALVVRGPYKYVRNPMMLGYLTMLGGEALILSSPSIGLWCAACIASITLYEMLAEEPALEKRFGGDYRLYKQNVGRWLPRLSGWTAPWDDADDETLKRVH